MIYELTDYRDPVLRTTLDPFDFSNPPINPLDLACDLAETMLYHNGIGLAANQVGLPHRVFVMQADEIIPCFNPKVVDESAETIIMEEGCLSYPGLLVKVKRPRKIKVRFADPNGIVETRVFDGMTARVFMHELSHLNGICHINEASYIHKEQALKRWKKING